MEAKTKKGKIKISPHMGLWLFLPNSNLGHFTLCQWFGNITKHIIITFESKKYQTNQKTKQNPLTYDNGHFDIL
jgi:hypothetical protein